MINDEIMNDNGLYDWNPLNHIGDTNLMIN